MSDGATSTQPPERRGARDVGRLLTIAFVALLALLAAIVVGGVLVSRDINNGATERYVEDAIPLKAKVQDLVLQMVNQQAGMRGYLIAANPAALDPFREGRAGTARDLAYIRAHTAGHPLLVALLARASPQIEGIERFYDGQVARASTGPAGLAAARRRAGVGGQLFREFRTTAALMLADTDRFVASARRDQQDRTDFLTLLLAIGGVAAFALAALLAWAVHRRTAGLFRDLERERVAAEEARTLLDTLVAEAPDGVAIFDRDLRYVRVNDALAAINGVPVEDHPGRTLADIVPGVPREGHTEPLTRVLSTGEPIADLEVSGRTDGDPGRVHHWLVSYFPIRPDEGPDAPIVALGAFVVDVTESKDAAERLALFSDVSEVLGAALGVEERLERLVRLLVPRVADFATVEVDDPDGRGRALTAAHRDPFAEHGMRGLQPGGPMERSVLLAEVTDPQLDWLTDDPEGLDGLRALEPRSLLVLPMSARGRSLGRMVLGTSTSGRRYDEHDLRLAEEVAGRAAIALDNARLYEAQSEIARTLQQSLLPPVLPSIDGLEVAARYRPVGAGIEVGGDFYDLFETTEETWAVVIGDVCGKGPRAAELTALARYTIRATGVNEKSPRVILSALNDAIMRQRADTQFLTAICACMETTPAGARLVMACAGHPPPLVLRRDGTVERTGCHGPLLGIYGSIDLPDEELELGLGDALLLYTDGVTEARGEHGFLDLDGLERLLAGCAGMSAEGIAGEVEEAVMDLQGGRPRDDVAIVALRAVEDGHG